MEMAGALMWGYSISLRSGISVKWCEAYFTFFKRWFGKRIRFWDRYGYWVCYWNRDRFWFGFGNRLRYRVTYWDGIGGNINKSRTSPFRLGKCEIRIGLRLFHCYVLAGLYGAQ